MLIIYKQKFRNLPRLLHELLRKLLENFFRHFISSRFRDFSTC